MPTRRLFVEKKAGFAIEADALLSDLRENLMLSGLRGVRIINRYDVEGMEDAEFEKAKNTIFSEPQVDNVYEESIDLSDGRYFVTEYLPGQYDQRADSAAQCVQILTAKERPAVRTAKITVLIGDVSDAELEAVRHYCINPVEARLASDEKPETLAEKTEIPADVEVLKGFTDLDEKGLADFIAKYGLAMDEGDIAFCRSYFKDTEKRDPTITEIRMIDTYWSDHCRHTTFNTKLENVDIEDGIISETYDDYLKSRKFVYGDRKKNICLMDVGTIAAKELKKRGLLKALDESEEINACSIKVDVKTDDGKTEEWLVMFKNETHNHPTEIEPFGGAATCLGGAIRDPLSGRSYVYQAMRVTGAGDPRKSVSETMHGKLPQRKLVRGAAQGYSSYGNQIGLATGQVCEIYDEGYVAKRMEIGAVIAAAPKKNVIREVPDCVTYVISEDKRSITLTAAERDATAAAARPVLQRRITTSRLKSAARRCKRVIRPRRESSKDFSERAT